MKIKWQMNNLKISGIIFILLYSLWASSQDRCEYFESSSLVEFPAGMSLYNAQEKTGADLLRFEIKNRLKKVNSVNNFIQVWDDRLYGHGHQVRSLIMGPAQTSPLPIKKYPIIKNSYNDSDLIFYLKQILKTNTQTRFVNQSMSWNDDKETQTLIKLTGEVVNKKGVVFVVASDNNDHYFSPFKRLASQRDHIILVGGVSHEGIPQFAGKDSEVVISTFDEFTASRGLFDTLEIFGGTSGATPQVTGALAAFEVITNYKLTTYEAKRLLRKTALKMPKLPIPNGSGSGILNTYGVGSIAFKIKEICQSKKKNCIKNLLRGEEVFQFKPNTEIIQKAREYFPECFNQSSEVVDQKYACVDKKRILNQIRAEGFKQRNNHELWDVISCVSKLDGKFENARYYSNLSERVKQTDDELIDDLIKPGSLVEDKLLYIKNLLPFRHSKNFKLILTNLIQLNLLEVDTALLTYVFSKKIWSDEYELLKEVVLRGTPDRIDAFFEYVLTQEHAIKHPEWINILHQFKLEDEDVYTENGKKFSREWILQHWFKTLFPKKHWGHRSDLIDEALKKGNLDLSRYLPDLFSYEHWGDRSDWVDKLLEWDDLEINLGIAGITLQSEVWADHTDWVEKLINKKSLQIDLALIPTLALPHWRDKSQWLDQYIDRKNPQIDLMVVERVLSRREWSDQEEWLWKIMKRGDEFLLSSIITEVLSHSHWNHQPQMVDFLLNKNNLEFDRLIAKYILSNEDWCLKETWPEKLSQKNDPELRKILRQITLRNQCWEKFDQYSAWVKRSTVQ